MEQEIKTSAIKSNTLTNKNRLGGATFDPRIISEDENSTSMWTSNSVELAKDGIKDGYKLKESPFNKTVKDFQMRRANLPFEYTEDELEILEHCMDNKIDFGNHFVQLKDGEAGWQQITLRTYQEKLLQQYTDEQWNILMFPRQSGKTTTTVVEIVHFATFNYDKDIVVIAQSELVVNEILQKIKTAMAGLPFFMQAGVLSFTKKGFVLDNGCRLSIGVASESVVQGFSLDFLFIDEFAYIAPSRVKSFWNNIYPALVNNHNSRCIIASTPNGRNMFWELWTSAEAKRNRFKTSRVYWWEVPRKPKNGETPEQALERFKNDTISNVGYEGWLMGFECSFDTQLNSIFHSKIQQLLRQNQIDFENDWSVNNDDVGEKFNISFMNKERISYNFKEDYFLIGVDLAEGLGQDATTLKVRKLVWNKETKKLNYKLIAVYQDNEIAVDDFAEKCLDFFSLFNSSKTRVIVENNNYGGEFFNHIDSLRNYESKYSKFDNTIFAKFMRTSKADYERGIRWDSAKKKTGVTAYRSLITSQEFDDTNSASIDESLNFGRSSSGTYSAQFGHDDLVMNDVTTAFFVKANNIFSRDFLMNATTDLRFLNNDISPELQAKIDEIEKSKVPAYEYNGFVLRDSKKEMTKRNNKRGGKIMML